MFPLLSTITFLPLIGGIVVLFLPRERLSVIRWTALAFAWADLLIVLGLMLGYSQAVPNFAATIVGASPTATFYSTVHEQLTWILTPGFSLNYSLDVDGISLLLVALTSLLTVVCIGASFKVEQKVKNYMAFMLLLESGMLGVFLASNLFLFYIFWELMLIPAYFLVGTWGGERRIYAAIKFVLYTSVGSLLMLAGIIALGYYHQRLAPGSGYTLDLAALLNGRLDPTVQTWLFLAFAAAFAIKVPLVPFHSWLPDAYSEAPAPVSAMLAGAMSKTGAYGFLRFCIPLFPSAAHTLAPLINTLAVVGILYCAWMALVQGDIKRLLGYSSISHLGVVMLGMFAFNAQGMEGSVLQMVNHGITTGALGLNSFAGEFLALLGAFQSSSVFGFLGTIVVVPAAWYLIRLFLGMMEGPRKTEGPIAALERKNILSDIQPGEFLTLLPLLVLIFYIGFQPGPLTYLLEPSVINTLSHFSSALIH
jgi:NADH-quinone oxidoreductase subunit M